MVVIEVIELFVGIDYFVGVFWRFRVRVWLIIRLFIILELILKRSIRLLCFRVNLKVKIK